MVKSIYTSGSGGYDPMASFGSQVYGGNNSAGWTPPSVSAPKSPARPYGTLGQMQPNIMGSQPDWFARNAAKAETQGAPQPGPFKGVPILGNIFDVIGGVGDLPTFAPLSDPMRYNKMVGAWDAAKGSPEREVWDQKVAKGWMDAGQAMTNWYQQYLQDQADKGTIPERAVFEDMPAQNLGQVVMKTLDLLGAPQRAVQNWWMSGQAGDDRLASLAAADDATLQNNPELIAIRDEYKQGALTKQQALGKLQIVGYLMANPADPLTSLMQEALTDPLSVATIFTGGISKAAEIGGKEVGSILAKDIGQEGVNAVIDGLRATSGRVLGTGDGMGLFEAALRNPTYKQAAEEALAKAPATARFWATYGKPVDTMAGYIDKVLNPWTLFGTSDGARWSVKAISVKASQGMLDAFGSGTWHSVMGTIGHLAGDEGETLANELMGRGGQQVMHQIGNESTVSMSRTAGSLLSAAVNGENPVLSAGRRSLEYGTDIRRWMRDKVEAIRYRPLPEGAGKAGVEAMYAKARGRAAQQLVNMFPNIAMDDAERAVTRMSDRELSMVDFMHYGKVVKDLLEAQRYSLLADPKSKVANIAFLGPQQLTQTGWKEFKQAVASRDTSLVRDFISRYDDLAFNLRGDVEDDVLLDGAGQFITKMGDGWLPDAITAKALQKLPKPMQDFAARYGPDYGLVWSPKDRWRPFFGDDGRLVGLNPWVDYVDGATAPMTVSRMKVWHDFLFNSISGSSIQRDAMHRLERTAAERWGMQADRSRALFHSIQAMAEKQRVTPRGLDPSQMYDAAMKVALPPDLKARITPRELAEAVVSAHEGALSRVGVSQKMTGMAKTAFAAAGNGPAIIAEAIFPNVRFKWNPGFQMQELVEAPFYLIARGIYPLSAVKDVGEAVLGGRPSGMLERFAQKRAARSILTDKTLVMRDMLLARRGGLRASLYGADQMEYDKLMLYGSKAAEDMAGVNSRVAKLVGHLPTPAAVKRDAEARVFRSRLAGLMKTAIDENAPGQSERVAQWWAMRAAAGTIDDGKVMTEWLFDLASRVDPDSVYSLLSPAMFKQPHIGARARVSTRLVRYLVLGDEKGETSWPDLARRVADPKDTEMTASRVADVLRARGADEDYISRVNAMLTFPKPDDFFATLESLPGQSPEVVAASRAILEREANRRGLGLQEYLAYRYAGAPQSLDQFGNVTGLTHYQVMTDSLGARGKTLLPATDERVVSVRDHSELPRYDVALDAEGKPADGRRVNQLTNAEQKGREFQIARRRRAANPTVGQPEKAVGLDGLPLDFVDSRGRTIHRFGPINARQWAAQVKRTIPEESRRVEYGRWYQDIRTGFMALADNDPVAAARLLQAFGVTQMNTSPVAGMQFMLRALERLRRGEPIEADIKMLGLGAENLTSLLAGEGAKARGLGQKLVDFIDSLLGSERRTVGVHGPNGDWGPVAGDIWAMRDLGFIDDGALGYVQRGLGATSHYRDEKVLAKHLDKKTGEVTYRPNGDVHFVMPDGSERVMDRRFVVGGSPTAEQYDYIVEQYNGIRDYLNATNFDGRSDWTAADVQALGWFRAKNTFGDPTGDVLDAVHKHVYSLSYDVAPAPGTLLKDVMPGIDDGADEVSLRAIANDLAPDYVARAQQMTGVTTVGYHRQTAPNVHISPEGVRTVTDTPGVVVEVVASSADEAMRYASALGLLSQQSGVVVTRGIDPVVDKAGTEVWRISKKQATTLSHRWGHEYDLPEGIDNATAERWHDALKDADPMVLEGSTLIRTDDGNYVVRATWGKVDWDESLGHLDPDTKQWVYDVEWWNPKVRDQHTDAPVEASLDGTTITGEWRSAEAHYVENDWEADPVGGHYQERILAGAPDVEKAKQLVDSHRDRAGMVAEAAYQRHLAGVTADFRLRRALTDPDGWRSYTDGSALDTYEQRIQRLYDAGDTAGGQRLQREYAARTGGTAESGGAIRAPALPEPWRDTPLGRNAELVPLSYLNTLPARNPLHADWLAPLEADIRANGFKEPIVLRYGQGDRVIAMTDGNHRLEVARRMGLTEVPVTFERRVGGNWAAEGVGRVVKGVEPDEFGYVPGHLRPSQIGVPSSANDPWMYHGSTARFTASIRASGVNRGDWVDDITSKAIPRRRMYGGNAVIYRARRSALEGGEEVSPGWLSGVRAMPGDVQVSRDGGITWEPVPTTLFQRAPRGVRGATVLDSQTMRAQVFIGKKARPDTAVHEMAHVYAAHDLDPSALRLVKRVYADEHGVTPPAATGKFDRTATAWTEDEHEYFVNQFLAWLKTGEAPAPNLEPVFKDFAKHIGNVGKDAAHLNPEMKSFLDDLFTKPVDNAFALNTDEEAMLGLAQAVSRRADREARDLIYFKGERSWLERSLNHQYLGLYPLSYMWGKVIPEMVEFLAFRPFGLKSPLLGINSLNKMYQHVMFAEEYDPELRKFMADHADSFRALAMLVPGLPWDNPVNTPLYIRRYAEAQATNHLRELQGKKPLPVDMGKILTDTAGYAFGPAQGTKMMSEMVGGLIDVGATGASLGASGRLPGSKTPPPKVPSAALDYSKAPEGAPATPAEGEGGLVGALQGAGGLIAGMLGAGPSESGAGR